MGDWALLLIVGCCFVVSCSAARGSVSDPDARPEGLVNPQDDLQQQFNTEREKRLHQLLTDHLRDKEQLASQGATLQKLQEELRQQKMEAEEMKRHIRRQDRCRMKSLTERRNSMHLSTAGREDGEETPLAEEQQDENATKMTSRRSRDKVPPLWDRQKRHQPVHTRSDDVETLEPVISHMTQQLNEVTADVQALKNANALHQQARGTTYIRWGHQDCPDPSDTVYSGFVGGSWYDNGGAAANHLCLPNDPIMSSHSPPSHCGSAALHGAEYDTCPEPSHNNDPVCALCRIPRSSSAMIAGTNRCWAGWHLEYSGYLMAGHHSNGGASEFICVDGSLGHVFGSHDNHNGRLLHYSIYYCGSLACPPYVQGKVALCAVCSK